MRAGWPHAPSRRWAPGRWACVCADAVLGCVLGWRVVTCGQGGIARRCAGQLYAKQRWWCPCVVAMELVPQRSMVGQ